MTGDKPLVHAARSVLTEWPLVAATLPTAGALLVAHLGWWNSSTAVNVVLVFNAVTLFGWGMCATRASGGRGFRTAKPLTNFLMKCSQRRI